MGVELSFLQEAFAITILFMLVLNLRTKICVVKKKKNTVDIIFGKNSETINVFELSKIHLCINLTIHEN